MTTIEAIATKRLTAREKVERDDLIVEARLRGRSWPQIAAEFDITPRQCQAILADWRKRNPSPRHKDALDLLDELLEDLQGVHEELAEIAATTTHDGTRLGAVRSRMDVIRHKADVLAMVGVMPDLRTLRAEINARQMAARIMSVLDENNVDDTVVEAMYDALTGDESSRAPVALNGAHAG
jgi:hypothetical protein